MKHLCLLLFIPSRLFLREKRKRAGISLPSPSKVVFENRELTYFEKLATASASVL